MLIYGNIYTTGLIIHKNCSKYIIIIKNIPLLISVMRTLIEIIYYISRSVILTIRLSSNIIFHICLQY